MLVDRIARIVERDKDAQILDGNDYINFATMLRGAVEDLIDNNKTIESIDAKELADVCARIGRERLEQED